MEDKILKKFQSKGFIQESMIPRNQELKSKSLFDGYENEIRSFLKKEKRATLSYMDENNDIDRLDQEFRKYIEQDPEKFDDFLKEVIQRKFQAIQQRTQCQQWLSNVEDVREILKFPTLLKENTSQKYILSNIFHHEDFHFQIQSNQIRTLHKMIKSEYFEDKKKQDAVSYALANTSFYHHINLYAPSIGNLYLPNTTPSSITHMMVGLCKGESDILSLIPLHQQNIREYMASFMIKKSGSNSDYRKKILSNVLQSIDLSYDDILKEKGKVKKIFIIPYRKEESTNNSGQASHQFRYDKYMIVTSSKEILKANEELLSKTWDLLKENPKHINTPFVKEILALYVYFAIQLFYETYYTYFSKINQILYEFQEDSRFVEDSIDLGILYIDKCIDSLKVFKKILLNNFYDFFLPSRLTKSYGIKIDDNGYVVCGSKLAVDYEFIIKKYPFQHMGSSGTDKESLMSVNHFLVGKRRSGDVYNPKEELYIGFYLPSESLMKEVIQFYKKYINVLLSSFSFYIFLSNIISKHLLRTIPYELFESPIQKLKELKTDSNQKSKNQIVILCYKYLVKSYRLIQTSKEKKYNKEKIQDVKAQEEFVLLSNFYYNYASILYEIVNQNQTLPYAIRNELLTLMKRAFKKIESKL